LNTEDDKQKPAGQRAGFETAKKPMMIAFLVGLVLSAISLTDPGEYFSRSISHVLMFQFRSMTGNAPELSPRVKVFVLDDRSVINGAVDYDAETWSKVIRTIASAKPSAILVNRSFAHQLSRIDSDKFNRQLAEAASPIFVAAPVSDTLLDSFDPLNLENLAVSLQSMTKERTSHQVGVRAPGWLPTTPWAAYGPEGRISKVFSGAGHNLPMDFGHAQPLVNVGSTFFLPHWTLQAGKSIELSSGRLVIDGREVYLDGNNTIPVNILSQQHIEDNLFSISEVLRSSGEKVFRLVDEGDVVLVLDRMANGTVDLEVSPVGRLPVNYLHLSLVNSVVTGNWLHPFGNGVAWTFLYALAGMAFAFFYKTRFFVSSLSGVVLATTAISLGFFTWYGVILQWVYPSLAFVTAAAIWRIDVLKHARKRATLLRHDLHGKLAPEKLKSILEANSVEQLDAVEQVLTIMFIDIVGFSHSAEKQPPKEAFSNLKGLVDQLRTTVHEYGGVVDRTLGDGMLCVFGYDFATKMQSLHHAEQALECAAKIQKDNIKAIIKALKTRQSVFPLRIGINTSNVYLGNLGDSERVDFTVIGNGVNFAQRLETACDRHMVMVGAATYDLVTQSPHLSRMLQKRYIKVKHSEELVEAYEFDPFIDEPALLNEGDEAYRQFIGVERSDNRLPVPYGGLIKVTTNYGDGEIINFSNDGFTVKLSEYYAKGVMMTLKLDSPDGSLGDSLEAAGLASIILEVRWARPAGDFYVHGCLVKNLSTEQRDEIVCMIRDCIQRKHSEYKRTA
jgi:class 3 adenylate cyclase